MIIHRAFYREAAYTSIGTIIILTFLIMSQKSVFLLQVTATGVSRREGLLFLVTLHTLLDYDLLLLLALFLGVIFTLSRWYRDSEMVVLAACGVGITKLLRPVMFFAWAFAVIVGIHVFYLRPIVFDAIERIKTETASQHEIYWISEGVFNEIKSGNRILYVESIDDIGTMKEIFVSEHQPGLRRVAVANTGLKVADRQTGELFLQLGDGMAYEYRLGGRGYRIVEFQSYGIRMRPAASVKQGSHIEGLSTLQILKRHDLESAVEWHSRVAKIIAVFILAAVALALSYTDPRRGRFFNLFIAIIIFFLYLNLLGIGRTLLREGRVFDFIGPWWVHILSASVAVFLLMRRAQGKPLVSFSWMRGR